LRVIAIGKASRSDPESEIFARYAARIKPALELLELPYGVGSPTEIKRREAASILAALDDKEFLVALDGGGSTPDSPELAKLLTQCAETGKKLSFVIGGAEGLDASIIKRANFKISLGRLTWPHLLVRAMLAEQIFRAHMILAGHPYHRSGRP
jgi:23S rRNA (pseudouridine1915-N3)-methyltransferase